QTSLSDLVGMGLRTIVSIEQLAFYIILVVLGILCNTNVIVVVGKSVIMDRGVGQNSNIIIINMAVSNLMVSVMRNALLVVSDLGIEVCFCFCPKVCVSSVNVWFTFYLSVFHLQTLRHVAPSTLLLNLLSIWLLNLLYSIPAHIFSTNGNANSTEHSLRGEVAPNSALRQIVQSHANWFDVYIEHIVITLFLTFYLKGIVFSVLLRFI
uniref:G-protein coupled receptors family 1 profile domain-containing protein n=1 Tax=Oryzias latipes TaxID=8090 RepID=A0A3P9KHN1_ORYLA